MKRLYLLRHAKSSWKEPGLEDIDRPLNGRGRAAAKLLAEFLGKGAPPDLILCSAARRTRETLALVERAWPQTVATRVEERLYASSVQGLLDRLRAVPESVESVMLIGHNPEIQLLARSLIGNGEAAETEQMRTKYPTGGLAVLQFETGRWLDLKPGATTLESFVQPRDLAEVQ